MSTSLFLDKNILFIFTVDNFDDMFKISFEYTSNIHLNTFGLNLYKFFHAGVVAVVL